MAPGFLSSTRAASAYQTGSLRPRKFGAKRLISAAVLDFRRRGVLLRCLLGSRLIEFRHFVAVEIHRDAPRVNVAVAALLQVVDVIPTLLVETVSDHRRSQQIPDLAARHAGFDLFDGRLIQEVALLN